MAPPKKPAGSGHGESSDGDLRLSPGTENYLLCLYKLWEDDENPTITQLTDTLRQLPETEGLGTSVPSVAGMVRRMQRQSLVDVGADKRIRLTKLGLEGGEDIARRHRLAEWLVVRLIGMDLHQAHNEAHRLEHGMSQELQEKLLERLGHPTRSPCGRPIPGSGEPKMPANGLSNSSWQPVQTIGSVTLSCSFNLGNASMRMPKNHSKNSWLSILITCRCGGRESGFRC